MQFYVLLKMKVSLQHKKLFWTILFWGWTILVVFLTAMPYNPEKIIKNKNFWIRPDYIEHLSFYVILALLFFPYYLNRKKSDKPMRLIIWGISGILFAVITEFYQIYIPNRSFNYWDMSLNLLGIFTGIVLGYALFRSRIKHH